MPGQLPVKEIQSLLFLFFNTPNQVLVDRLASKSQKNTYTYIKSLLEVLEFRYFISKNWNWNTIVSSVMISRNLQACRFGFTLIPFSLEFFSFSPSSSRPKISPNFRMLVVLKCRKNNRQDGRINTHKSKLWNQFLTIFFSFVAATTIIRRSRLSKW